jgi:hypothetical protein
MAPGLWGPDQPEEFRHIFGTTSPTGGNAGFGDLPRPKRAVQAELVGDRPSDLIDRATGSSQCLISVTRMPLGPPDAGTLSSRYGSPATAAAEDPSWRLL